MSTSISTGTYRQRPLFRNFLVVSSYNYQIHTGSYHITRKNNDRHFCILTHAPTNQLCTEELCTGHYTALETCKKLVCMNPVTTECAGESQREAMACAN